MPYVVQFDPADTPRFARQGCGTYRVYSVGAEGQPQGEPAERGVTRGFGETKAVARRWPGAAIVTGRRTLDPDTRAEVWRPWLEGLPHPWTPAHTRAHRASRRT